MNMQLYKRTCDYKNIPSDERQLPIPCDTLNWYSFPLGC